ncbi:MAG TPA: precorrin-3B C(17)-methyltransferase [Acetobacteraceae bacterium]|nr:precorrin-3B C(17)-methyltransferase [Acetobacteraceae bacterium]
MSGALAIVGLGPGAAELRTAQAEAALASATVLVGYGPYLDRVPPRAGQARYPSDNRQELDRARHALDLAASGARVALVSGGDPGVFAMASAVFEAIEAGGAGVRGVAVEVVPGISAMLAAAARLGAPLGHDFCAISLSDNLKPWDLVLRRLTAVAEAGLVIALYNPVSIARPWQLGAALDHLGTILPPDTPVAFATAIARPDERIAVVPLRYSKAQDADMRTLVLVGSPATRSIARLDGSVWLYTPRASHARADSGV